ncbi:MAG: hypothetical protein K0Q89_3218 [Thermomicrobiales bacterium]|nr:hypothetical protein [Thermomicrobiales bacterium]
MVSAGEARGLAAAGVQNRVLAIPRKEYSVIDSYRANAAQTPTPDGEEVRPFLIDIPQTAIRPLSTISTTGWTALAGRANFPISAGAGAFPSTT